ncbi:MAG: EVE domain-containing protein [Gemmatimonadetes bacterium]|nr:EVE domain-containing protein [Gemmatimonadota bacterium]
MNYWLLKSEPNTYSISDLERDGSTSWEGVRNYSARNNMRQMKVGDLGLYYHSNANPPGVAGICKIAREAYPDYYAWNKRSKYYDDKSSREKPRWFMVDVQYVESFDELLSLERIKDTKSLRDMVLVKQGRLSVQPVKQSEFDAIVRMAGGGGRRG